MIITDINSFVLVKRVRTRFVVRIFFDKRRFASFWLSEKQYNRLSLCQRNVEQSRIKSARVLCVFDGDRFVWAGEDYSDISDMDWLVRAFGATYTAVYRISDVEVLKHIPKKVLISKSEPDADLIR